MKEKTQIRIIITMIVAGVGILVAFGVFYAGRYKNRIEATEVYTKYAADPDEVVVTKQSEQESGKKFHTFSDDKKNQKISVGEDKDVELVLYRPVDAAKKKQKSQKQTQKEKDKKEQKADKKLSYTIKPCPADNAVKKYENYRLLTVWKQGELQKKAYTDEDGMRKVGRRYCIAVGTFYTSEIGTKVDLMMENGNEIPCIVGDIKSDQHTDELHQRGANGGCVAEFIVDTDKLPAAAKIGNIQALPQFAGEIKAIKVYE